MTELSSQLYEGTLRAERARIVCEARGLRPSAVDAGRAGPSETLAPVPAGEIGILRFEDSPMSTARSWCKPRIKGG